MLVRFSLQMVDLFYLVMLHREDNMYDLCLLPEYMKNELFYLSDKKTQSYLHTLMRVNFALCFLLQIVLCRIIPVDITAYLCV